MPFVPKPFAKEGEDIEQKELQCESEDGEVEERVRAANSQFQR